MKKLCPTSQEYAEKLKQIEASMKQKREDDLKVRLTGAALQVYSFGSLVTPEELAVRVGSAQTELLDCELAGKNTCHSRRLALVRGCVFRNEDECFTEGERGRVAVGEDCHVRLRSRRCFSIRVEDPFGGS